MQRPEVRFHPEALREAEDALRWYSSSDQDTAMRLETEIERALRLVRERPQAWRQVAAHCRRFLLKGFPFSLVYRIEPWGIHVVAIAHHRRKPNYWAERL